MQIPLSEAKPRLSELTERASGGEEFILTVHGKPKARLVPLVATDGPSWEEIMKPINDLRAKIKPEDLKPNRIIEERKRRNYALRGLRR